VNHKHHFLAGAKMTAKLVILCHPEVGQCVSSEVC